MRRWWLVLVLYIVLSVVMTWPVTARLGSHLPGGTSDLWTHQWTFWWVKDSLVAGRSPFHTDLLFHPRGVSLVYQNIAWLNIAVWLPLQAILGSTTAYSVMYVAVFALNGFSMYLLAREVTESGGGALIGGVVFGFWPYTLSHYGHPNLQITFGVPLALLYLKRTLENERLRDGLLAGLFVSLIGVARWQMLIMASGLFGLYVLWRVLVDDIGFTRRSLGLLALAGLTAAVLMAPLAAPVAAALFDGVDGEEILVGDESSGQTDLLAYALPTRYHPLWTDAAARIYENFVDNKVYVPFLGYTVLALAVYGALKDWRSLRLWLVLTVVYIILALGSQLRINGRLYPQIPMPYRLVDDLFLVRALRHPDRFNVLLGLPMGMLAAIGVASLMRRDAKVIRSTLMAAGIAGLILWEYNLIPYHTEHPVTPSWYHQLARAPGQFAVLDLPMNPKTYDKQYMFYQTTHRKPLVEGHVSRPPQDVYSFIDGIPFLRSLRRHNAMDPALVDVSHQLGLLANADIRYIILHKDFASSEQLTAWRDWLTFEPLHEDDDLVVYTTDPQLNRDFALTARPTDDLGLLRASVTPIEPIQGAVIDVDARWASIAPPGQDYDACLNLNDDHGRNAQSSCGPLSRSWPTSSWSSEEIVRSHYRLQIPRTLDPGGYILDLRLADSDSGKMVGEPVHLGRIRIAPLQPMHPLNVRLGKELLLMGYDLSRSNGSLRLTLYWQARCRMTTSYKVFVHLVDTTTEEIVAQDDAVPRRWSYPTTDWQPDEVVRDTIPLPLTGVRPGRYRLRLGCYDPVTGERLPVYDDHGERYPEDVIPLAAVRR